MTSIICEAKECIFFNRKSGKCRADIIGIKWWAISGKPRYLCCDSYYPTPKEMEPYLKKHDMRGIK